MIAAVQVGVFMLLVVGGPMLVAYLIERGGGDGE